MPKASHVLQTRGTPEAPPHGVSGVGRTQVRPAAASLLRAAIAGGVLCLAASAAMAQAPGGGAAQEPLLAPCTNMDKLGATQLRVSQQYGRALVEVNRPNSAGRKVEVEYGDESYVGKFDQNGRARMGFALTAAKNEVAVRISETPVVTCKVDVPEFNKIFRVVLRWRDPVQLDLHVIEPGRRLGDFGHISPSRPNNNLAQGMGQMDVVGGAPADGATAEVSYVVPDAAAIPADSVFGYRVDYVTRGAKAEAPYCDDLPLASPLMELIIIDKGKVSMRKIGTNRARCGEQIPEARRLMVIRP